MVVMKAIILSLMLIMDGEKSSKNTVSDSVDIIEINHFLNDSGQTQLDQFIFWDYSPSLGEYVVVAWRSIKTEDRPYKSGSNYVLTFKDTRDGSILRKVYAKHIRETWTDYDPETVNQEYLDRNNRRELTTRPKPKPKKQWTVKGLIPLP